MIVVGLGIGVGLATVLWGLFPPPLTLRAALARLSGEHAPAPLDVVGPPGRRRPAPGRAPRRDQRQEDPAPGRDRPARPRHHRHPDRDLRRQGRRLRHRARTARPGAVGRHGGHRHPSRASKFPTLGVLVLGAAGAVSPFVDLHKAAERRRRHFCHSLSTYASLVSMAMAGAMGWSSALEVASSVSSTDWAMDEIAQSLLWAQAYRKQPWEGLERLAAPLQPARPHRSGPVHVPGR